MEVHEQFDSVENATNSPSKVQSMPGTPLQQISPERLNQRIMHSPSLPNNLDHSARKSQHRLSDASDVKARIALINSISQNGSPIRSTSPTKQHQSVLSHAAIQRAILGREEAEALSNTMAAQFEAARARERLVAERVESLMEQISDLRTRQRHERQVYEKEIRSSKKNEYKAELAVIKLQEELRETKTDLEGAKVRAEHDRAEKEKARQEAFERAYVIAGITEEIQTLKEKLKVVEQERDNAVTVAEKIQANVLQPIPSTSETFTENFQGEKTRRDALPSTDDGANADMDDWPLDVKCSMLQQQIRQLTQERKESEELVHFMNMQCQFLACPCRVAERDGVRFVHDHQYDQETRLRTAKKRKLDDKPLPKYVSWMQKRAAKQLVPGTSDSNRSVIPASEEPEYRLPDHTPSAHATIDEEEHTVELPLPPPPAESRADAVRTLDHVMEVDMAAQIPLPSPSNTPDHTAQLEEITQVIVEAGTSTQPFSFSTSMTGHRSLAENHHQLHQSQSSLRLSDALFDISPPKQIIPRSSTAMGVPTIGSPVRLVPDSPLPAHARPMVESDVPDELPPPRAIRVALNDTSPVQQTRTRPLSQPRSQSRHQSRGRSPGIHIDPDVAPFSVHNPSSPASSTLFPITPVVKQVRSNEQSQTQTRNHKHLAQKSSDPDEHMQKSAITTTVPLRDAPETDPHHSSDPHERSDDNQTVPRLQTLGIKDPFAHIPGTPVTREAALAQIRARRDRARSVNMRNKSDDMHPDGGERKGAKTPGSVARRGLKIDLSSKLGLTGERGRDVSQASAPGRF